MPRLVGGSAAGDVALARRTGVGQPVTFALSLAHRLLGSPLPAWAGAGAGAGSAAEPGPAAPRLERWILARLARQGPAVAGWRYQAGIRWMGLCLAENWRQRFGIAGYDGLRRLRLLSLDLTWAAEAGRREE